MAKSDKRGPVDKDAKPKKRKLTDRRRLFVDAYLTTWNATLAAKSAGYSQKTAGQIGHELLKNPEIREEIERRLSDHAMTAEEAMTRLAAQARVTIEEFIDDKGEIDILKGLRAGKGFAVKKFKTADTQFGKRIEVELYDAQNALLNIWKNVRTDDGLPTDVIEVRPIDYRKTLGALAPRDDDDSDGEIDSDY